MNDPVWIRLVSGISVAGTIALISMIYRIGQQISSLSTDTTNIKERLNRLEASNRNFDQLKTLVELELKNFSSRLENLEHRIEKSN